MKQSSRAWFQAAMSTSRVLPRWTACSSWGGTRPLSSAAELSGPPGVLTSCFAPRPRDRFAFIGRKLQRLAKTMVSENYASGPARTTSATFLKRNGNNPLLRRRSSSKRQIHDRQHSGDTLVTSLDKSPEDLRD